MKSSAISIELLIVMLLCCSSSWAKVIFCDTPGQSTSAEELLECACQFYGLDIEHVELSEEVYLNISNVLEEDVQALIIAERALALIDVNDVMSALAVNSEQGVSVLLLGITSQTDASILRKWSKDKVMGCKSTQWNSAGGFYSVTGSKNISRHLAGHDFPIICEKVDGFTLDAKNNGETILQFKHANEETGLPFFTKAMIDGYDVFFLTQNDLSTPCAESLQLFDVEQFLEMAPLMMFLRYVCGEQCWHTDGYFANFTIDDPWLVEPYGHLSYKGLLEQMDKANFHTTIAFIPWNYNRNKKNVVSLFKERSDRFSICVHGNNHDRYEFYKYETTMLDPWPSKSLDTQEANIKQAIMRMQAFKKMTGLSYDPVMVFPHEIAPAKTLGVLKKYNFLSTSNKSNVPLGSTKPNDPLYSLRSVTVDFENFASFKRYVPTDRSKTDIAIDLFLGNPVLFLGHAEDFTQGIDAFNETAKVVNRIEPNIEWRSLGYIAKHSYLKKKRDEEHYDIRMFCRSMELENTREHEITYCIRKKESFYPPVRHITVNGELYPFKKSGEDLCLTITIPGRELRDIEIEYENDLALASIDISKNDPRIKRFRMLSDFRDITLAKNIFGRAFLCVYYKTGLYKLSLKRLAIMNGLLAVAIYLASRYLLRRIRNRRFHKLSNV